MIVVSAASGAFGRLVVERLPARHPAGHVGVAVRAPGRVADLAARGVRVRHGDYADPHTLLRHPFHSEAFLDPGPRAAVARGELDDGTGGRGINTASRADLAEAAARVLTEDGHLGRAYDFTGTLGDLPRARPGPHPRPRHHRRPPRTADPRRRRPGLAGGPGPLRRPGKADRRPPPRPRPAAHHLGPGRHRAPRPARAAGRQRRAGLRHPAPPPPPS